MLGIELDTSIVDTLGVGDREVVITSPLLCVDEGLWLEELLGGMETYGDGEETAGVVG